MSDTVYANPKYRDVDVGAIMRVGHPDITEGDERIVAAIRKLHADRGTPLRIIDVGSGSGDLSLLLARELPDCEVIANDTAPNPSAQAADKLAPFPRSSVFDKPFEDWHQQVDVVISWGSHHHLAHDYLDHVRSILSDGGLFIVGDEFCPEYFSAADKKRLAKATQITLVDGYIFDSAEDVSTYKATGQLGEWNLRMEQARREALWTWYKFVGDYAVQNDAWPVLIAELGIARDDLITDFDEEHKTSPYLLERELELNGFNVAEKVVIGDREPTLQSFVIYICRAAA
jgi:cyclopropane fatty-acyl-phospholipid synthase-like methyltransferase